MKSIELTNPDALLSPNAWIPDTAQKETAAPVEASLLLPAWGNNKPGKAAALVKFAGRFGSIVAACGTRLGDYFQMTMRVVGPLEHLEFLKERAEQCEQLFPKTSPPLFLQADPTPPPPCQRWELFLEVVDEGQSALILEILARRKINLSSIEIRQIPSLFHSDPQTPSDHRIGVELLIDVPQIQIEAFSHFKVDLVEIAVCDELIKIWGPIREGEPGRRPAWKTIRWMH